MERPRAVLLMLMLRARPWRVAVVVAGLVVVGAGVALGVRAWVVDDGGDATPRTLAEFRPASVALYDFGTGARTETDGVGVERATPFRILLPAYVPRGYALQSVVVSSGAVDSMGRPATTGPAVLLQFGRDAADRDGFTMQQQLLLTPFERRLPEDLRIALGLIDTVTPARRSLSWQLCHRTMFLSSSVDGVTGDEFLRVA